MNETLILIITGLVLILGGIWGGAVIMHYCAEWIGMAAFFMALVFVVLGAGLLGAACGDRR